VGGHPERALSRAKMLDTVSLYWFTNSAASSARLYWHSFGRFAEGTVDIPAGCSLFPWEIMQMSRRMAETRYRNISYWNELSAGGHFAAMEQPELFVGEVKAAFATMSL
jgi:pimeloyl-ACP methyl ester carboxylesterase